MQLPRSSGVSLPSQLQPPPPQQHTATPPLTPQPSPGQSRRSSIVAAAAPAGMATAAAATQVGEASAVSPAASPHQSPQFRAHAASATERPHKAIFIARRAGRQAAQQQQPQQLAADESEASTLLDSPAPAPASLLIAPGDDFASDLHTRSPVRLAPDHLLEWPTSRQGAPAAASVQHAYLQQQHSFSASIDAPFVDAASPPGSSPLATQPYALSSSATSSPVRSFIPRRPLPPLQHAPSTPRSSNQQRTPRSAQASAAGPATRILRSSSSATAGEDSTLSGGSNVTSPYCRSPCTPFEAAITAAADASAAHAALPHRSPTSPPVSLPSLVVHTQLPAFPFSAASSPSSADGKPAPAARVQSVVLPQLNTSGREAVGTAASASARLRKLTDPSSHKRDASKPGAPRILAALDLPAAVASAQASITAQVQAESRSNHSSPAPAPDSPALRRLPRTPNPGDGALDAPVALSSSPLPLRGGASRHSSVSPPALVSASAASATAVASPKNDRRTRHAHKRTDSKMVYDPRMDRFSVDDSPDSHDEPELEDGFPTNAAAASRYSPRRLSGSLNSVAGAADADSAPHSPMHWSDVDADDFFEIQDHEREVASVEAVEPADSDEHASDDAARSESPSELLPPSQQIFSPRVHRREPIVTLAGASPAPMHEFDLQVAEPSAGPRPWERGTRRTNAHAAAVSSSSTTAAVTAAPAASNRRLHFHSGELPSPTDYTHEQSDAVGDLLDESHQQSQQQQLAAQQEQPEFDSSAVEGNSPASDGEEHEGPDHESGDRSGTQRRKRRDTGSMVDLQGMGSFIAQQLRAKPNLRLHLSPAPMLAAGQETMPVSPVAPAPPVLVASALPAHLLQQSSSGSKVKRIGLRPSMLMNGGSSIGSLDSPSSSSSSSARNSDVISSDAGSSSSSCLSTESSVASSRASYTTFGTPSLLARGGTFDVSSSSSVGVQFGGASSAAGFQSPFDSPRHLHTHHPTSPLHLGAGLGGGFSKHPSHPPQGPNGSIALTPSPGSIGPIHHRRLRHQRHSSTASASSIDEQTTEAEAAEAFARAAPQ